MTTPHTIRKISVALALASVTSLLAQTAPKATAPAQDEQTVTLTPFEVTTSKDVGYAAGNTLSGGRVDTPLEITPA